MQAARQIGTLEPPWGVGAREHGRQQRGGGWRAAGEDGRGRREERRRDGGRRSARGGRRRSRAACRRQQRVMRPRLSQIFLANVYIPDSFVRAAGE